jgi:hypothetical protein
MSPAELRARVAESRARQGLGPTITDPAFQQQLAVRVGDVLVRQKGGDERAGGGPVQPARRRLPVMSSAAVKQAQDDGR